MNGTLSLVVLLFFSGPIFAQSFKQSVSNLELLRHGKELYTNRCVGCHGVKGDGKGPASAFLDPKPRDFTSGVFKFKSTPNESLPTDEDLVNTLTRGVWGTSMPSFFLLSNVSKFALVEYIKSFSQAWNKKENLMAPIQGAPVPVEDFRSHSKFIARAQKGRQVFLENCVTCHGIGGKGDGEGGVDLVDDWDNPIKPADLTRSSIKSGKNIKDIYRVLLTGMAGTPMPSFKDAIEDEALWDVTAFVLYLRGKATGMYEGKQYIQPITQAEAE